MHEFSLSHLIRKCFMYSNSEELANMGLFSLLTGKPGPSGFGSSSTSEQVTQGIDATNLIAIVTGSYLQLQQKITSGHYLFFLIGLGIIISKPDYILLGIKEDMNMEKSVMFVHVPQDNNMKSCRWRERYWSRDGKNVGS